MASVLKLPNFKKQLNLRKLLSPLKTALSYSTDLALPQFRLFLHFMPIAFLMNSLRIHSNLKTVINLSCQNAFALQLNGAPFGSLFKKTETNKQTNQKTSVQKQQHSTVDGLGPHTSSAILQLWGFSHLFRLPEPHLPHWLNEDKKKKKKKNQTPALSTCFLSGESRAATRIELHYQSSLDSVKHILKIMMCFFK